MYNIDQHDTGVKTPFSLFTNEVKELTEVVRVRLCQTQNDTIAWNSKQADEKSSTLHKLVPPLYKYI